MGSIARLVRQHRLQHSSPLQAAPAWHVHTYSTHESVDNEETEVQAVHEALVCLFNLT